MGIRRSRILGNGFFSHNDVGLNGSAGIETRLGGLVTMVGLAGRLNQVCEPIGVYRPRRAVVEAGMTTGEAATSGSNSSLSALIGIGLQESFPSRVIA